MKRFAILVLCFRTIIGFAQSKLPLELPDNTSIAVRLTQPLRADKAAQGDDVLAEVTVPVLMKGDIVIPKGARVHGRVITAAAHQKHMESVLQVLFDRIEWSGETLPINAYVVRGMSGLREAHNDCGMSYFQPRESVPVQRFVQLQAPNTIQGVPQPTHTDTSSVSPGHPTGRLGCATPGAPDLHYISVRNFDKPPGATALISKKKTIALPAGTLVELRHIASKT